MITKNLIVGWNWQSKIKKSSEYLAPKHFSFFIIDSSSSSSALCNRYYWYKRLEFWSFVYLCVFLLSLQSSLPLQSSWYIICPFKHQIMGQPCTFWFHARLHFIPYQLNFHSQSTDSFCVIINFFFGLLLSLQYFASIHIISINIIIELAQITLRLIADPIKQKLW